jgi:hypothetical protein
MTQSGHFAAQGKEFKQKREAVFVCLHVAARLLLSNYSKREGAALPK